MSLTATFGQVNDKQVSPEGTIAPNKLNTVTGIIDNFNLSGGEANSWSVKLDGTRSDSETRFSGTAKGGHPDKNGTLSGNYYHTNSTLPQTTDTKDDDDAVVAPAAIGGEFNAYFTDGSVAGAFGVQKK